MKIQPAKNFASKMLTPDAGAGSLVRRLTGWSAWASRLAHRFALRRQRIFLQPVAMVLKRGEWRGRSPINAWHFNLHIKWPPTILDRHQFTAWQNNPPRHAKRLRLNNGQSGYEKIYYQRHLFAAWQNNLSRHAKRLRLNNSQPRGEKTYHRLQRADPLGGRSSWQPRLALNSQWRGGEQPLPIPPVGGAGERHTMPTAAKGFRFLMRIPRLQAGVTVPLTIQRHELRTTSPAIPLQGRSSRRQDTLFRGERLETLRQPRSLPPLEDALWGMGGQGRLFGGVPVTERWQRIEIRPGQFRTITPPFGGSGGGGQNKMQLNEAAPPVFRRPKIISEAQPSVGPQAQMPAMPAGMPSPPSLRGGDSGNGLVNGLPPPNQDLRQLDLNKLTDQIMQQIDRRMVIWRERTGRV